MSLTYKQLKCIHEMFDEEFKRTKSDLTITFDPIIPYKSNCGKIINLNYSGTRAQFVQDIKDSAFPCVEACIWVDINDGSRKVRLRVPRDWYICYRMGKDPYKISTSTSVITNPRHFVAIIVGLILVALLIGIIGRIASVSSAGTSTTLTCCCLTRKTRKFDTQNTKNKPPKNIKSAAKTFAEMAL